MCHSFSNTTESTIFQQEKEELRFNYNTFSQNTAVEIRIGQRVSTTQGDDNFLHLQTLDTNSEQVANEVWRTTVQYATPTVLREALRSMVPQVTATDDDLERELSTLRNGYVDNAADCVVFKIKEGCL